MSFPAKTTFTLDWTTLADVLTPGTYTAAQLKSMFNQRDQELLDFVNSILNTLTAVAPGSSGSENIGSAAISGVAGATAYAQLVDLKAQLQAAVIGTIPDNTLDYLKLNAATKSLLTEHGLARQAIMNGNFEVWQRGTSFTGGYMADRWIATLASNATFSRQIGSPPIGSSSYARVMHNVLGGVLNFGQCYESDMCNKLKGQAVSLSILMRRDATYDGQYQLSIDKNTSADTSGGTWTTIASSTVTLSTSWQLFKLENISIPSDANGLRITISATGGTRPVNSYAEFSQVQFNTGAVALPYQPRSFGEELRLCQRYYWKSFPYVTAPIQNVGVGDGALFNQAFIAGSAVLRLQTVFPVTMRIAPTVTIYNPNVANAQARNSGLGADCSATGTAIVTDRYLVLTTTTPAGTLVAHDIIAHATCDSEL